VAFDAAPGGDPRGPWCKACRQPIAEGQPVVTVHFKNDEHGFSGLYHEACGRPFASMARILNFDPEI
jgi:hypothetical protein